MRFDTIFAKILHTHDRTRAEARSKWRVAAATRDQKGARLRRRAAQAAAIFRFEKGFLEDTDRARHSLIQNHSVDCRDELRVR